jgi:molecular chaperone HtpG
VVSQNTKSSFLEVDCFNIDNVNGEPLVIGWMMHHDYLGSLKYEPAIRGLRVRSGNMQIGNERVLSEIFPEERFNNWMVGEVHIIDQNIRPNGKRDGFENTGAFRDLKIKLVPVVGRPIAHKCRENSAARHSARRVKEQLVEMQASLDIISFGLLSDDKSKQIIENIEDQIYALMNEGQITSDQEELIHTKIKKAKKKNNPNLQKIPNTQKKLINNIVDVIYDSANSSKTAENLISEISDHLTK